jgi:hypothetical protein
MPPVHKALVVALVVAIAFGSFLVIARPVAAAQNRPTWTQGDFWIYSRTEGTSTSTVRLDVHEKTTLTLTSGTYDVWHLTVTTTPTGGNASVQHSWVRDTDLAIAKANFSFGGPEVQVTFDPPLVQAQFPLTMNAQWSLSTTIRVVDTGFSLPLSYSGTVVAEQSTAVAAGTFSVAVVRSPSTGTARDENHYSEGAGNSVREESYDNNGNRIAEQQLTSFRYQSGTMFLILIVAGVILAAVAIAAVLTLRRRRRVAPPAMPPPPPPGT